MRHFLLRSLAILSLVCISQSNLSASWLSDITGIDINVPKGTVNFGPPKPAAIPQMLQNLPKDVGVFLLNPVAGGGLAFAIRNAKEQARPNCNAVPPDVVATLSSFFPPDLFPSVCGTVVGDGHTLDTYAIHDFGMAAITLEDVVVFRSQSDAHDPVLWSHELTHVLQYRRLGVEAFAAIYASPGFDALEQEARLFDQFVARQLQQNQPQQPLQTQPLQPLQYWRTTPGWDQQITSQQWATAAQTVINPLQCSSSHIETNALGQAVAVQVNDCPIPIKVVYINYLDATGAPVSLPCRLPGCLVPAASRQEYLVYVSQPLTYVGMAIAWQ